MECILYKTVFIDTIMSMYVWKTNEYIIDGSKF